MDVAGCGHIITWDAASRARALDLWPLAEFTDERTVVLYPFYVHEGDFLMLFPFYYRTNQARDHHFLWPMLKMSEGRLTRALPMWFSVDADTFTMFPFIRQTPDYTFWAIPPIYNRHDGEFKAVFPLFAKSPRALYVAPSFYKSKDGETSRLRIVPLCFSKKTAESREVTVPVLFHSMKSEDERTLWIIPSYYNREGEHRTWNLFPLFSSERGPGGGRVSDSDSFQIHEG